MSLFKILAPGFVVGVVLTNPAAASVHFWHIEELYSDPSGSLQFLDLETSFDGQNLFKPGATTGI